MYTVKQVIRKAKNWYNSYTEYNKVQLIDAYNTLTDSQQKQADAEIVKFLPIWENG